LLRLLLPQLLAVGARVTLADPHHAPVDPKTGEDWRPIVQRLDMAPAIRPGDIDALFSYLSDELGRRLELREQGREWGPALFLAYDEWPIIVDTVPQAPARLARLLREGRKVDLFVLGASQTHLVKAVGGDSSARDNYRTAFYTGGDLRSAVALLDLRERAIDEGRLTTGLAYLRASTASPARLVRVPYASNDAVTGLLAATRPASQERPRPFGFQPQEAGRVAAGEKPLLSHQDAEKWTPEETRCIALLRAGKSPREVIREVYGVTAGNQYREAAAKLAAIITRLAALAGRAA
jgi:hypothetical protein